MTYRNLFIICERKTEVAFIKNVLAEYLLVFGWTAIPLTLPTGRNKIGVHKGGWRRSDGYTNAVKDIWRIIATRKNEIHTTFFDLYGFPEDIPCVESAKLLINPSEKAKIYEKQLLADISVLFDGDSTYNQDLFIPYVQPYEFENFLFVDPKSSANELSNGNETQKAFIENEIRKIAQSFDSPEHINNSYEKAPSKRLEKIIPGFIKHKAGKAGFSWLVTQRVGIQNIRKSCKHFDDWLIKLEEYS